MRKIILALLMPLLALVANAENIQGVTDGDKAVTYSTSASQVNLYSIDDALIPEDGTLEIPATVEYNGKQLPVYYQRLNGEASSAKVKKLIIHGSPYGFNQTVSLSFPALEEIVTVDNENGHYHAKDGVLYYDEYTTNTYSTLKWCPISWNPEGKQLFQEGDNKSWRSCMCTS